MATTSLLERLECPRFHRPLSVSCLLRHNVGLAHVVYALLAGDVALSPSAGSFFTGFSLTLAPSGTFSTSLQVVGKLYAASYGSPTPSQLTTLIGDVVAAYNYGAGLTGPNFTNLASG